MINYYGPGLKQPKINKLDKVIEDTFFSKPVNAIKDIYKKSAYQPTATFDKIYKLLHRKELLLLSFVNLSANKGSTTSAVTEENIDGQSYERIEKLSTEIKNRTFRFSSSRRIYIEKPRKPGEKINLPKKFRPLTIPEWKDRIVQEAIRIILNAIYEPSFIDSRTNFGFRPKMSCNHAIKAIEINSQGHTTALEGDIKGAYDNVNHDKLIEILQEKIKDTEFLKLIKQACKSGIMSKGNYQDTLLGVPQGGIVSPILFNIYMKKFDDYITNSLKKEINNLTKSENTTQKRKNYHFEQMRYKLQKAIRDLDNAKKDAKGILRNKKDTPTKSYERPDLLKQPRKQYKKLKLQSLKMDPVDYNKTEKRINYVRYADDWVLTSNISKKQMEPFKEKCKTFLMENLHLELAMDKTKITDLRKENAKFLGFTFKLYSLPKYTKVTKFKPQTPDDLKHNTKKIRNKSLQRTISKQVQIGVDMERVYWKLVTKGFCSEKDHKPLLKASWSVLAIQDIVISYNYIIRGLYNYYTQNISKSYYLSNIAFILNVSCYHTFARKFRTKISTIMQRYGKPIQVPTFNKKKKNATINLLNYKTLKPVIEAGNKRGQRLTRDLQLKSEDIPIIINTEFYQDPFSVKFINWRSGKILLNPTCCICGEAEKVELHHVRKLSKNKTTGFAETMRQINKKQIPVCRDCHMKIHKGIYDSISLKQFANTNI